MACSSTYDHYSQVFSRRVFLCVFFFCFRAELQIETTQDYATDSWFLNVFTGSFSEQEIPTGLFKFVFITSSSSKIISLFCHNLKFEFCCQSFDVIFPPKTVKIEKQKRYDFLEYKVLPSYEVWVQTNKIWKRSSCRDTTTIQVEGHNQPCCMEVSRWREAK